MSKLGNGGLLGNSADLNARRENAEQHPQRGRTRTTRSALGSVVDASTQPLTGSGGSVGQSKAARAPGAGNTKGRQAP